MNTGLKNKLMVMAAAAGLAGFGVACGSDGEAPAASEEGIEATTGGEASCAGAMGDESEAIEEGVDGDEGVEDAEGGEASCGAGSCGG